MNDLEFRTICYEKNIRYTRVRAELFTLLHKLNPVPWQDFLHTAIAAGFDQVSVYRTVYLFERLGICDSYGAGKNRILHAHDQTDKHHHFIRCATCGRAFEFENEAIEMQLKAIALRAGFQNIGSHFLEISGTCSRCSVNDSKD